MNETNRTSVHSKRKLLGLKEKKQIDRSKGVEFQAFFFSFPFSHPLPRIDRKKETAKTNSNNNKNKKRQQQILPHKKAKPTSFFSIRIASNNE